MSARTAFGPAASFGQGAGRHRVDVTVIRRRVGLLALPASSAWTERLDWSAAVDRAARDSSPSQGTASPGAADSVPVQGLEK